jgi:hypothetical protein
MDPIREGIAQIADKVSWAFQNAFQTFGFLPDGRELVELSETDAGTTATFSDRSDEGWPGFSVNIPKEATFHQANMSFLGRRAQWVVAMAPKAVVDHLTVHNDGFPEPDRRPGGGWNFVLDGGVEVGVATPPRGYVLLAVKQARDPDSIEDVIRAKSEAYKERWRETGD